MEKKQENATEKEKDDAEQSGDTKNTLDFATDTKKSEQVVNIKKAELDQYKQRLDEATDTAKRTMAEFENFKKRCEKERQEYRDYAAAEVISKLLPVLDSFEQALKSKDSEDKKSGLKLIYGQLISVLEKEGLTPMQSVGKKYDCYRHDILMQENSDKEEGIILEEFQKGYMFKDKVLRHAKVKVAKKEVDT